MKYNKLSKLGFAMLLAMLFGGISWAAVSTITQVNEGVYYQKITSENDLTDGEYLIVYEEGGLAFNGGLAVIDAVGNSVEVTVSEGQIESSQTVDAATFTYDATQKTLKGANGLYIGQATDANGLKSSAETAYENTISFDEEGNANIVSGGAYLRYNYAANQTRFRYYKSSSYTNQKAIQLYKKIGGQTDTRTATTVTLDVQGTIEGEVGESMNLPSATVTTADGTPIDVVPTWSSSDPEVASIGETAAVINFLAPGTVTITASYAGDESTKPSSASFKLIVTAAAIDETLTSLKALQEAVTETSTPVKIQFNDVFVTAVKGNNAYLADAQGYGVLVYQKDHGLEAGQVLNGTINANLVLYRGQTEITGFSTEGLTITTTELTPTEKTIDAITAANQSTLVTLKGVTYSNGMLTDGTNEITYYDNFNAGSLEEGATYDITGIVIVFNTKLEIAPRTAEDVVKTSGENPDNRIETFVNVGEDQTGTVGSSMNLPLAVVSIADGAPIEGAEVVWSSSDENIAKVEGTVLNLLAAGTATITATFAGDDTYKGSEASFKMTVTKPVVIEDGVFDFDMGYDYGSGVEKSNVKVQESTWTAGNVTMTLAGRNCWNDFKAGEETKGQIRLYAASTNDAAGSLTLSVPEGKVITNIAFIGATLGNMGTVTGEFGEAESFSGYIWTGSANSVTFTATGRTDIYTITVTYDDATVEPVWAWADIKADFTNQNFLTDEEKAGIADESNKNPSLNFGLLVDSEGNVTRIDKDAPNANAVITGKYHSDQHGLANFSATVKVLGTVKVSMGTCAWGGDVTVKDASGATVATFNTNTGACYHNDKDNNIVFAYYKVNEPTTLTISGGSYTPYFAVEAVSPEQIPNDVKFIYDIANSGAEGVAPEAATIAIGKEYTLPKNFTLYKEGYTLTGWTDGENTYAPGEAITAPEAEEITLYPVFTENEVTLADRTEPVTVKFNFRRDAGAPTVGYQNQTGIWVAQATIGNSTIDVKADFDTNNGGKFANGNWNDLAQLNGGTKWTVPSCKGATVSMEAYSEITTTTIDGQTDYTSGKTISYTIAGSAPTVDVVIGDGSYYRYIQVVLPVVQSQGGGESYDNEMATIEWPMDEPVNYSKNSVAPEDAFTTVAVDLGAVRLMDQNGKENATGTSNVSSGVTFSQMRPTNDGNDFVTWVVKPAAGLTFTPTKVTAYIVRFGTDSKSGVTFSAKAGEGDAVKLGTYTAPRNNKSKADDKYGSESDYAENGYVEIELTEAQQTALTSGEGFSLMGTIGVGNAKAGGIAQVTVSGLINGTKADVAMYTLATVVAPEEAGSINVYPVSEQYEAGSDVKLTATENFGYDFVSWTDQNGVVVSEEPVFTYTMNGDATLTANFVQVETYELALTVDGTNDYMVTISPAPTVIDGKNMYEAGQAVQLTANQYEGLVTFTNWSDGETNSSKLIKMAEDINITAYYAQADIIAGWDFYKAGSNGRKADFYAQDNDADALNLVNTETGEVQGWLDKSTLGGGGYESFAGAAVNWRTGSSNGDVGNWHWQTKVNAGAFENINVQFQMLYNYNAYQTYDAEYSLDGESWTKFGSITMTGTKQAVQFKENLPAEANNQTELYIRMKADKTSAVDGAASANDGNTLAMFFITGTPKLVDDGTAPVLVSTVPENGAVGASASGKIVLTFDERVKLADTFMPTATLGNLTLTPAVSGKTVTFEYKGLEYGIEYTFNLPGGSIADLTNNFVADPITLTFTTMERPSVEKGLYDYVVENVDDLMAAIAAAQARADKNVRYRIFIKNGKYTIPLSSTMKTVNNYEVPECITFINTDNVSFIGESRDGVIITNGIDKNATFAGQYGTTSKYDGIGNSDVFQLRGQGYYWQDLTVETGMDDATGRDLAIHDRGTMNIYKNVGLRGYQDTWTSNNDNGLYYFEDGYVRGRTDYMCGKGDIFWNRVELRQIAGGYAAVPSKPAKYGWIYKDCVINGEGAFVDAAQQTWRSAESVDGNYTLGRPWGSGTPIALFIDTKMNVVPSADGWNEMSGGWPARFAEYNSMTSTGSVIDLSSRKKTFGDGHENNPVLTAEEALENSDLHRMYGDWDPTLATEQAPVPANVKQNGNNLVWDNSNYALLWAIVKDGAVIDFTTEPTYALQSDGEYAVRAANEMGGLSEASATVTASGVTTGITEIENAEPVFNGEIYNVQGIRVDKARKGLYIVNGRKVVIK